MGGRIGRTLPTMKEKALKSIDYYRGNPHKQIYYDNAVTGIGKCFFCKKTIPRGTPIFWFWDKFKKYKKNTMPLTGLTTRESTDLNIKRKICYRCIEEDIFQHILERYKKETVKIKQLRKAFKRTLKGKKCKRAVENTLVLEELQKEDFTQNFDSNKFHG